MSHERLKMWRMRKNGLPTFTSQPVEGYYEMKPADDRPWVPVHIWYGPPVDPATGETCDRSHRWYALIDGNTLVSADDVWVNCCARPITAEAYATLLSGDHTGEAVTRVDFTRS